MCGKCLSPWEWDGLQRDPQPGWSQTPQIPPTPSVPAFDGVTFVSPHPSATGGCRDRHRALGTRAGDTPGRLWGHSEGLWVVALGAHGGARETPGPWGYTGMCTGVVGTDTPTGAPLPWLWPARRDQRPGLKKRRKIPGAAPPSAVRERRGGRRGSTAPGGPNHRPPSPSSTDNPAGPRSPSLYLCTKDVILPDSGQYSQLKANLCK